MKKLLLSILSLTTVFWTFAQSPNGISVVLHGTNTDISGLVYQTSAPGPELFDVNLDFINNTNQTQQWIVTRKRLNVPTGWSDQLCWLDSIGSSGGCYGSSNLNPWSTPVTEFVEVAVGEYGKLKCEINPDDLTSGAATYRYYVSSDGVTFQDSVDVQVEFNVASIKPIKEEISVSIVPNPATDYIQISMTGIEYASLKMVDVFGSTILKENIGSTKKLNVSDFNSGFYFLMFDLPGRKSFTRKVIIRN